MKTIPEKLVHRVGAVILALSAAPRPKKPVADKSESRKPKAEGQSVERPERISEFGFRNCFGIRNSDFGFGFARATTLVALATLWLVVLSPLPTHAARISEPDTVIYGRIVQRLSGREFLLTQGELVWKLRTRGPAGREHEIRTRLAPLANGLYSFQLRLPHQVLAYDLSVDERTVPLTAAGATVEHVSITVDGRPLSILPGAISDFTLAQAKRAGTQLIDLELAGAVTDSDGDGLPDWWEDANGYDKWDARDAARATPANSTESTATTSPDPFARNMPTFAEWRAALFPEDTRDLDQFGQDDFDGDGISNFLEYAFDLNPKLAGENVAEALPRAVLVNGRFGVAFRQRVVATDLKYRVDISEDLFNWRDGTDETERTSAADESSSSVQLKNGGSVPHRFFRVRVSRTQP